MNQAVRSLSISLESIELSTPAISSEEIATIQDANFNVPVIIDTYSLKLIETEASEVPRGLRHRVTGSTYTWAVYQTSSDPLPDIGLKGDIWIRTLRKPRVYFKSARNSWERWERCPSLGVAPNRPTLLSQLAVYHPWLRRRRLEFDGTKLEWGLPETPPPSYLERLDRQVTAHGWPKYSELSLDEVAARLSTGPPSPGRIVVGATSDPRHDPESRTPPPPPPVMQEAPSNRTVVIQPDGFTLARKSFPPPGAVVPTTGFKLFSAFAADASRAHATTAPSSNAFWGSQGSFPPPVIADAATKVIVKVEEEEAERAVLELIKRSRDETSSPPPIEPPLKRVKIEDDTSDSALAVVSTAEAEVPSSSGGTGPTSIFCKPAFTYEGFLASLPSPLTHQEHTLEELGVTSLSYLESFATAPPSLLSEMTAELQEHGFTFMEALILRNGLTSLRPPRRVFGEQPRLPESVEAFLDALEPSMAHHAPMFHELGIETTHLPILARFDAASYAEFEETLRVKGLSWADRFLIKVALRTRLPL
ncbi:hypothetical protein GY45DRAFT_1318942 [Cubamyces sp. BRFM 1775]|nr:hypothetical protein GY45DRAFT_1318942 [Cubamyces sp. BRFM 1775]